MQRNDPPALSCRFHAVDSSGLKSQAAANSGAFSKKSKSDRVDHLVHGA
jgi:hypothetical protein